MSISPVSGLQAAKIIVSPTPGAGNYTSITAACAAASSGQTILVKDGTYTENFSVPDGVNIAAFESVSANVVIKGKISFSTAAVVSISGLQIRTNSDYFLSLSGTGVISVNFKNCNIVCFDNTGIDFTNSNADSSIAFYNCVGDISVTSIAFYSMTSVGSLSFVGSIINNSGLTTTPSNNSAGAVGVYNSNLAFPLSVSGSATCNGVNSYLDADSDVTALSLTGTCTAEWLNSSIATGTEVPVTVGTGCTALLSNCSVFSSNTVAVSGLGTLYYAGLVFNSSATSPLTVTTQIVLPYAPASSGGITTFDIDSGGPITGVGGVVTFNGIGGNYTGTTGTGEMFADNKYWLSPYVVDPSTTPGKIGSYTTIQAAINAAGAAGGGDVYVRSNTTPYTENLSLIGGVNIIAVGPDGRLAPYGGADAIIVGNHTFTGSGAIAFKGIYLNNTSGTILTQSNTTGISLVGFIDCQIVSNGDFVHVSSTGVAAIASLLDTNLQSNGQVAVVGVGGTFSTIGSQMQGFTGTAISNSGNIALRTSTVTAATNCIEMLTTGSSAGFDYCQFGGTIGVLFTAAGGANSDNCTWDCTDGGGFYIAGASGNYTYDNDNIYGSATAIASGITQQKAAWRPRAQAIAAPSTGGDYGTCAFDSAAFTVTDGFVQLSGSGSYISLSPYIVGQPGDTHAGFTTISAAIAQAVTDGASAAQPANIYIKPGTYTESPTMVDGINLIGMMSNSRTVGLGFFSLPNITSAPDVLIAGTLTYAPTSASVDTNASITNVVVAPTAANTPAIFLNPNTGGTAQDYITLNNVVGLAIGTGAGLHDSTASIGSSAGNVSLDNCYFSSYVDDTVGLITGRNCFILGASTVSFTSNATFQNCNFNGSYLHSSTNGPSVFTDCQFSSSVAALPGSSIVIYNCTLSTPITSGGCSYGGLTSFGPLTVTTGGNSMHSQWGDTILSQVRASGDQTLTALTSYYGNVGTGIATITLPTTNVGNGQVFIIKDEAGNATTNNLTVNVSGGALIDGAASQVISVNYGVLRVIFTGTNYFTW